MTLIWKPVPVPGILLMRSPMLKGWQAETADNHVSQLNKFGHLTVIVGKEDGWWHLSISHRRNRDLKPGRYPTWDEIKEARYRFCPDDKVMGQLLPPKAEWVNVHDTTFHLWEIRKEGLPRE